MKIEKEILETHQAKLTVEVDSDEMESMKRRAARKIAQKVKIPGFRPGKAPYEVIVRQIGEGSILEEALELLVDDIYPKVIEQAEINPYGPGSLENVISMNPPVLEFRVPLEAEVVIGDYHTLREPYEPKDVTEGDIDEVLNNMRERQAIIEPVDRSVMEGDQVTVRLSAKRLQSEDGVDEMLIGERSIPIIVFPSREDKPDPAEWPFPGFSQHLVGLSANDEKTVRYTYPEDASQERYRGVDTEFQLMIESVKARSLPELNHEFAASIGEYDSLDALRAEVRKTLEAQAQQSYNEDYDERILQKMLEQTTFKYPPQMLDREIDNVIGNLEDRLKQQGLDLDLYMKTRGMDMEGLREEVTPTAKKRLEQTIMLLELAKIEDIQIDSKQAQAEAQSAMNYFTQVMSKKEARKLAGKDVYNNLLSNVIADKLINQSMERLRDIFKGKAEITSVNENEPQLDITPEAPLAKQPGATSENEVITSTSAGDNYVPDANEDE